MVAYVIIIVIITDPKLQNSVSQGNSHKSFNSAPLPHLIQLCMMIVLLECLMTDYRSKVKKLFCLMKKGGRGLC